LKITVKVIKLNSSVNDVKSLVKYENDCVSQILPYLPSDIELEQACEVFMYLLSKDEIKKRFKSLPLLFLLLLTHDRNINEAISKVKSENEKVEVVYQIICCKDRENKEFKIRSREDRIKLSINAIHSMEWLS
jgi:hypothetical protein